VSRSIPLELPDNVPACHEVIRRQAARIEQLENHVEHLEKHVKHLEAHIDKLQAHIEQLNRDLSTLKRQLFGQRRERFVAEPEANAGPHSVVPEAMVQVPEASVVGSRRTSKGRQKRLLDESLPREVLAVEDEASGECRLIAASAPAPLIERCYAGPALLAYLVASRFADHLPYYREEDILAHSRHAIHRSTQWRWMRALATVLRPLVDLMRQRTMQSEVLGIDETPCAQLCPGLGRTRKAYLYAKHGDATHPYVCFDFAARKDEPDVRRIVGSYQGYLQSDAYICYELIAQASEQAIIPVGCWAHARRKFEPLIKDGHHPQAGWILSQIQKLYDIEDRARELTDSERHALRQGESWPLVAAIHAWLQERDQQELPRSPLRAGVNYLLKRWEAFERFLENGAIPIDNNRTEASIKGPVMGKKAWLFFGNDNAGETAAILYTLAMSCKRHAIDVQAYLLDVFRRIKHASPAELESLLPDRWIEQHPEARIRQRVQESQAAAARKRWRRARRRVAVASG
jgi:transposase